MRSIYFLLPIALAGWGGAKAAPLGSNEPSLRLYLDADRTHTKEAGYSIELGMRAALADLGGSIGGHPVELVVRDHRGNSRRSRMHLEEFVADDQGLAVFCGLHSPPVLAARDFIHGNSVLMLDPWAAAGPITRGDYSPNWIFRLSVDDTKAGGVIARHAVEEFSSQRPHLLLERTAWGRSNEESMTRALRGLGFEDVPVHWFDWGIKSSRAEQIAEGIMDGGADSVLLVANAPEGRVLLRALAFGAPAGTLPVASHWGITGGDLRQVYPADVAQRLDLAVIQTRAANVPESKDERVSSAVQRALDGYPELSFDGRIGAPVGFVHAYDLMLLLDSAVRAAGQHPTTGELRAATRLALENLERPVQGLLRTYERPFRAPSPEDPDAHEALDSADLLMVRVAKPALAAAPR